MSKGSHVQEKTRQVTHLVSRVHVSRREPHRLDRVVKRDRVNAFARECKLSGCALVGPDFRRVSVPAFASSAGDVARMEWNGNAPVTALTAPREFLYAHTQDQDQDLDQVSAVDVGSAGSRKSDAWLRTFRCKALVQARRLDRTSSLKNCVIRINSSVSKKQRAQRCKTRGRRKTHCSIPISAACMICDGVPPMQAVKAPAAIDPATPTSAMHYGTRHQGVSLDSL